MISHAPQEETAANTDEGQVQPTPNERRSNHPASPIPAHQNERDHWLTDGVYFLLERVRPPCIPPLSERARVTPPTDRAGKPLDDLALIAGLQQSILPDRQGHLI